MGQRRQLVARRRKERTYPELAGDGGRARLVVLAAEGGRWSDETADFLSRLAKAKSFSETSVQRGRKAYIRRWNALLVCPVVRAFSIFLTTVQCLDLRPVSGTGGDVPSVHEVLDARFLTNKT